ncbi:MAG TPA: triple tyrosine motif-containing protein, partial [Flavisolibacter sp.]
YRYRLTGYDSDWSDPVPVNSVNYASLPPGNYVFEVTAMNARGQWSTAPARFSFRIVLPFYRRAWFLVLVFCALLYIVYLVRLQRLKHRYKIEKIRLHIARDLHDDVGATLGSINLLTKTATRKLQKETAPHDVIPIFEKIGDSAEHTLEAMDDIVWSINPEKDTLHDLVTRMREFAIPLFESRDIDFHYDIQVKEHDRIAMNLRRTIFLIYKEAVHNIVRHSHATVVNIGISCQPHSFSMSIADNGKGFDPLAPTARNGLKNMHKRSEGVKGNLEISSGDGGTRIHFQCRIG